MSRINREELNKIRVEKKQPSKGEIIVSMGTCGIAAGAQEVFDTFKNELSGRGLADIELKKTGCLGMCFCEPNLIIRIDGMPEVLYGYVDEDTASRIISDHIMKKNILNDSAIFMPSRDIFEPKGGI